MVKRYCTYGEMEVRQNALICVSMRLLPRITFFLLTLTLVIIGNDAQQLVECEHLTEDFLSSIDEVTFASIVAISLKKCLADVPENKDELEEVMLKKRLPPSIRNAVFLDEVCILNTMWSEFMYSPVSDFQFQGTPQARRVFTWIPGDWDHHYKGDWKLVHKESNRFFIVAVGSGEYLATSSMVTDQRRRVATIFPNGSTFNEHTALWTLEPIGNNVYIKNVEFSEYLYAVDGQNYDAERRAVNTWSSTDDSCRDKHCVWYIGSCY